MSQASFGRGVTREEGTVPKIRILLVDENRIDLRRYRMVLRGQGYLVDCSTAFSEGMERLERVWYDLIIFSQEGDTFNGQPLLECAIKLNRHRPVLVLTRSLDKRIYMDAIYLGALDYVEKPQSPLQIVTMVQNCLSHCVVPTEVDGVVASSGVRRVASGLVSSPFLKAPARVEQTVDFFSGKRQGVSA